MCGVSVSQDPGCATATTMEVAPLDSTAPLKAGDLDKELSSSQSGKKSGESKAADEVVPIMKLFSKATPNEVALMTLGAICASLTGLSTPVFMYSFGNALDGFDSFDITGTVNEFCLQFLVLGAISFVCGTLQVVTWSWCGEQQSLLLKAEYVKALLRQDMAFYDENSAASMPTRVTRSMAKIQDGIGRKFADLIMNGVGALGGIVVAFILDPVLAAIMLACIPLITLSVAVTSSVVSTATADGLKHYSSAGAIATEVIAGIRTVASLCSEPFEVDRYSRSLVKAEAAGIRKGIYAGLSGGSLFASFFLSYAVAFFYATRVIAHQLETNCVNDCASGGKVLAAVFATLIGAMMLGQMSPSVTALREARAAAVDVFKTLERVPEIDSFSTEGKKFDKVDGRLELSGVGFHYPARPENQVYKSLSLSIAPGESLALVGPSGGGKSSLVKLLLRFYDPTEGTLSLDGVDVRDLNVAWYRDRIGYVSQEPVLFATSVRNNIANGKPGATEEEVVAAAKAANAHDFIKKFPKGYNTHCGEGGLQLSGGQKQRIAIARAIIKNPAILLLDEATSALDSESERVVQQALDNLRAAQPRTTITIAHRLSTIQDCGRIAVVSGGGISEIGTHAELMALGGQYAQLCASQGVDSSSTTRGKEDPAVESIRQLSAASRVSREASLIKGDSIEEDKPAAPMRRLYALNRPEWPYLAMGIVGAIISGALFPVEGLIIANLQNILFSTDPDFIREQGDKWILGFVGLAVAAMIGCLMNAGGFAVSGEKMVRRLRQMTFSAIIRHDVGWFDAEEHATSAITSELEQAAHDVSLATGVAISDKLRLVMTLGTGIVIGLIASWQIGLVAIACIPLIALAGVIQMASISGSYGDEEGLDGGSTASAILGGALNSVSTVQAFNLQLESSNQYSKAMHVSIVSRKRRGFISGLVFGWSQLNMFLVWALLFWYGAKLVAEGTISFLEFFLAMFSIILGAFGVGTINAQAGAQRKGQLAAARLFAIIDEPLTCDPLSEDGAKPASTSGAVSFKNVTFAYPTRQEQMVYGSSRFPDGLNLSVPAGDTVALVGASGSGKSTCLALLMRFYELKSGEVLLDGRNIKDLNVHWLRSQIGYVGQEPVLFSGTIRENILKGKPDATQEEIEKAARDANAHDFIVSFPEGYDTDIGEKSALLSGGQKQRIAIARAIIKDPHILLLDEATSALDNESERVVQEALDRLQAMKRRTTLVVAHRLTTIRNADNIVVIGGGGVLESGTHDELMSKGDLSTYATLYTHQTAAFV
jgi:ATP-binding cassette subfamily B (MDR/TAP) protein 1